MRNLSILASNPRMEFHLASRSCHTTSGTLSPAPSTGSTAAGCDSPDSSRSPEAASGEREESGESHPAAVDPVEGAGDKVPEVVWQDLEARWNSILGLEASIDRLRISMESLRSELESSRGRQLKSEEKFYALNADVAQWNKAKSRAHHALPKMREFIHRAVWALGAPERKKLDELFKTCIEPRVPCPEMGKLAD